VSMPTAGGGGLHARGVLEISQAYAVFAYAWHVPEAENCTLKRCRGFLAPLRGELGITVAVASG